MGPDVTHEREWLAGMRRRNLAASTIDKRRSEARRWLAYCDDKGVDWRRASAIDLELFLDDRPLGAVARATAICHLAAFYRWAAVQGLADDPTPGLIRPRIRRGLPRPIREVDLWAVYLTASGRLRLILGLAALAGLRACEIAGLRWDDVDLVAGRLRVQGKGDVPRVVPIHPDLADVLADAPRPGPWVLGRQLGAHYVSRLGCGALRDAGVSATLHQLRHRFGTVAYEHGGRDLLGVAELMGHASVVTTQGYAKVSAATTARIVSAMPGVGGGVPGQLAFRGNV